MKSSCTTLAIALACSSILSAGEVTTKDHITLTSETLSLSELLSYIENTVSQLISVDEEVSQIAYHELKESLKIIYAINWLHPTEAVTILQVLDECYATLADAIDKNPAKSRILEQSLALFISGRNYDYEALPAQSLQDWTNTVPPNELKFAIEMTDAHLVYIQDNVSRSIEEGMHTIATNSPPRLLYSTVPLQNATPKILIIKSDSTEYKVEGGYKWKLGGKDHGKSSAYMEGEVKDKNGNYAKGKVSKEEGDDGYDCEVKAGKEKKKK